jgi:hypothetical protein
VAENIERPTTLSAWVVNLSTPGVLVVVVLYVDDWSSVWRHPVESISWLSETFPPVARSFIAHLGDMMGAVLYLLILCFCPLWCHPTWSLHNLWATSRSRSLSLYPYDKVQKEVETLKAKDGSRKHLGTWSLQALSQEIQK